MEKCCFVDNENKWILFDFDGKLDDCHLLVCMDICFSMKIAKHLYRYCFWDICTMEMGATQALFEKWDKIRLKLATGNSSCGKPDNVLFQTSWWK